MRLSSVFVVAMLASSSCFADTAKQIAAIDATLKACIDKDSSNVGMKICTDDAETNADKLLNGIYKAAVEQLKAEAKPGGDQGAAQETLKRLVASERAWIAFRDADCELEGTSMLGGTGEGLVILDCTLAKTEQRVKSLDELFGDH